MYLIPSNYDTSGKLFNGMFDVRRFIETGILVFILFQFLSSVLVGVTMKTKVFVFTVVLLPIAAFGIIGINGDSLTQFLFAFFMFFKNRKKLRYRRVDIDESNR